MKSQMHVLIIPSWYPQFIGDVGGSFFREQAIALKKAGHRVGVIYPQVRSLKNIKKILKKPCGVTFENDEGVDTLRKYTVNFFSKSKEYNKNHWIQNALQLFEIYIEKHGRPHIIHVHSMLYAGYVAQLIQEKYGIPYVITEHSSAFARNLIAKDILNSLNPVIDQAKECIAVSQTFANYLEREFPLSHWTYIPNIVNDVFFEPIQAVEKTDSNQKIRIISICHLNKNKNIELLIKAFAQVLKQGLTKNIELVIGGDGEERQNLEALVETLALQQHVKFLGAVTRDQVRQEISQSSMFVVSSKYETFGVVVVEALALGKPVVATKCGGPESIIQPHVGLLVENDSVTDLATGILQVSTHLSDYDADVLKKYCFDNFSEKSVVNKLTQIYHEHSSINE